MISPLERRNAFSKLGTTPRFCSLRHTRRRASCMLSRRTGEPSVDASSTTSSSSPGRNCARIESTCGRRKRAPLWTAIHTDTRESGMSRHRVLELSGHAADAVRNAFQHHAKLAMPVAVQDTVEQKQGAKPAQLEQYPLERDVAPSEKQHRVA